jgi:orotidine-5'-phosphate decarboxylase
MNASDKLHSKNDEQKFICIGLDTDADKIPSHLKSAKDPVLEFNKRIIEATSQYAAAYKLNFAFYERYGAAGFETLKKTIELIPKAILIIGDAKRGDIGNTSAQYAKSVFDYFGCDAITVNPYMGYDSVKPFLEYKEKLTFFLALTSNPGAADVEKLTLMNGDFVYQKVISLVKEWNVNKNCGIVFGATQFDELKKNIEKFGDLAVLLPGVGTQGGSLEEVVKLFSLNKRKNFLINISRGIIYKVNSEDFDKAASAETAYLNNTIIEILSCN